MSNGTSLKSGYMYGLILTPVMGWTLGTLTGAVAGNIPASDFSVGVGRCNLRYADGSCGSSD